MSEEIKTITSPIKAIKAKCMDCCCMSRSAVEQCGATECPLYEFKLGKNPYRTGKGRVYTEEQKEQIRERFRKARVEKTN
jgi:hypothetical protein